MRRGNVVILYWSTIFCTPTNYSSMSFPGLSVQDRLRSATTKPVLRPGRRESRSLNAKSRPSLALRPAQGSLRSLARCQDGQGDMITLLMVFKVYLSITEMW
jgi:hypothetical protein